MSEMAHFFVVISGSKIHERVAHFFIDIYIFVDSQHICMQLYASFVEKIWKNDDGTENGDMPLSKYRKLVCF